MQKSQLRGDKDVNLSNIHLGDFCGKTPFGKKMTENDKTNIIVFGAAGAGKSSVINLLANREVAVVGGDCKGVTFEYTRYEFAKANIWDTIGMDEGDELTSTVSSFEATKRLIALIHNMRNGISLLIQVHRKGRINADVKKNFATFYKALCGEKVPMILCVTYCEHKSHHLAKWRDENGSEVTTMLNGLKFDDIVCVTTVDDESNELQRRQYNESKCALFTKIVSLITKCPPFKVTDYGAYASKYLKWLVNNTAGLVNDRFKLAYNANVKHALKSLKLQRGEAVDIANAIYRGEVSPQEVPTIVKQDEKQCQIM